MTQEMNTDGFCTGITKKKIKCAKKCKQGDLYCHLHNPENINKNNPTPENNPNPENINKNNPNPENINKNNPTTENKSKTKNKNKTYVRNRPDPGTPLCGYSNGSIKCYNRILFDNDAINYCYIHYMKDLEEKINRLNISEAKRRENDKSPFTDPRLQFKYKYLKEDDKRIITAAVSHYKLSGPILTKENVLKIYKEDAKKHHPDKGGTEENFKKILNYKIKLCAFLE